MVSKQKNSSDIETTAVVVSESTAPVRNDFFELDIEQQIARATVFANALKKIVDSQNLAVKFGNNQDYLPVEVWQTLGSFLGVTPREKEVKKHDDGSFEAQVDLVRLSTGMVIGSGSGYCGMDEPNWKSKPAFSRRSMAITRGTGKAYRTAFSWIMVLAGYAPTPAEEMIETPQEKKQAQQSPEVIYTGSEFESVNMAKFLKDNYSQIPESKYGQIHIRMLNKNKDYIHTLVKEF